MRVMLKVEREVHQLGRVMLEIGMCIYRVGGEGGVWFSIAGMNVIDRVLKR